MDYPYKLTVLDTEVLCLEADHVLKLLDRQRVLLYKSQPNMDPATAARAVMAAADADTGGSDLDDFAAAGNGGQSYLWTKVLEATMRRDPDSLDKYQRMAAIVSVIAANPNGIFNSEIGEKLKYHTSGLSRIMWALNALLGGGLSRYIVGKKIKDEEVGAKRMHYTPTENVVGIFKRIAQKSKGKFELPA